MRNSVHAEDTVLYTLEGRKGKSSVTRQADLGAVKPIFLAQYVCSEDHWAVTGDE